MSRPHTSKLELSSKLNTSNYYFTLNKNSLLSEPSVRIGDDYYLECCCSECFTEIITDIIMEAGVIKFTLSTIQFVNKESPPVPVPVTNCDEPEPSSSPYIDESCKLKCLLSGIDYFTENELLFSAIKYGYFEDEYGYIKLPIISCDNPENNSTYSRILPSIDENKQLIGFKDVQLSDNGLYFYAVVINAKKIEDRVIILQTQQCENGNYYG